jgi:hypothetical protein
MAKVKHKNIIIEVRSESGKIVAEVVDAGDLPDEDIVQMNKNLEFMTDLYQPKAGDFVLSVTNAIATWLANGLNAEVIEYDEVKQDPDVIY